MKKISIKTVDGCRFDYMDSNGSMEGQLILARQGMIPVLSFFLDSCTKYFFVNNIVSITEQEVDR